MLSHSGKALAVRWGTRALAIAATGIVAQRLLRRSRRWSFAGRVVAVTGGSRGLGLVLARQWAAEGARLALLARNAAELERARRELADRGCEVVSIVCDVRDERAAHAAIDQVVARFGRLDVLANVAGVIQVGPIEHMSLDDFKQSLAVHVLGPLHTIQAALPHMRRQGGGRIVNISSIGGKVAVPHLVPYSTGKFALSGLSQGLHAELAKDRIYVTNVCPGLMRTGSTGHASVKGRHEAEYAWFAIADSLPLFTVSAENAARQTVGACRYGDSQLIISIPAKLLALSAAVLPNLTAEIAGAVQRLLPSATGPQGEQARTGYQSSGATPTWLTRLSDAAAARNNELPHDGHRQN